MSHVFDLGDLGGLPSFSPPHHTGTVDHKLVHEAMGARQMAIWHGEIQPLGTADEHVHEEMEQAFYVLAGEAIFTLDGQEHRLVQGGLIFIPAKVPHRIVSVGQVSLRVLIITAPPPAGDSAWRPK